MATVFTRIIAGEIPGTFIYKDESVVAFLSINPLARGHVLVVPVAEIDEWTDMDSALAQHVMTVAHAIGRAQKIALPCERVGLIVAGYEVPHCHVHVIPTTSMAQLSFANAASSISREELESVARELRDVLPQVGLQPIQ